MGTPGELPNAVRGSASSGGTGLNWKPDDKGELGVDDDAAALARTPDAVLPTLLGHATPEVAQRIESFVRSIASIFEAWLKRSANYHTQRTYRRAVMGFIDFMGIPWPTIDSAGVQRPNSVDDSWRLLTVSVADVRAWRDELIADGKAPATLNHRIAALSGFFSFLREVATTELRLPIQVPNPAHAQFIARDSKEPVEPTLPLTLSSARRLMALPKGEDALAVRDRAILKVFLYTGIRLDTGCRLAVEDFHDDPDSPTLALQEKGRRSSKRRVGIHFAAAEAIREHLSASGHSAGPLFRARRSSRGEGFSEEAMSPASMHRLLLSHLEQLPGAVSVGDGGRLSCRYIPHSLRATTATLLDEAGVGIKKIQELLGHKDIRVTQTYIKLGRDTRKSASHEMPL